MSSERIAPEDVAAVRLVIFDVDGVLTDAGVYIGSTASGEPVELKRWNIQDGVGLKMLQWGGLDVVLVSGRVSESTTLRAQEVGVECHQEPDAYKIPVIEGILEAKAVAWEEVAMIGDDIPDLAALYRVGFPAAVANATPPVLEVARWVSSKRGGHGAAREFCDALLEARGELDAVVQRYVSERAGSRK